MLMSTWRPVQNHSSCIILSNHHEKRHRDFHKDHWVFGCFLGEWREETITPSESGLMDTKRKFDPHSRRYAPHPQKWVRKMGILPYPKVHPTNESIEDSPREQKNYAGSIQHDLTLIASSFLYWQLVSRTSEKALHEGLVEELPRDRAEEESPFNAKVASGVTENVSTEQNGHNEHFQWGFLCVELMHQRQQTYLRFRYVGFSR
ncbi:uncharacterized protein LOC117197277 [Orcinus orca]|uniref:uncharacterized protein LOC117197277 n=1 Tax=Orcinus orca TaxID=9733 RepID=UPI0014415984|nr:uncharacterized protein LOC117197277 [Orcinus orca]XP_049554211.1 uncharacterized protein LOC117197277 [Orcinus orca]